MGSPTDWRGAIITQAVQAAVAQAIAAIGVVAVNKTQIILQASHLLTLHSVPVVILPASGNGMMYQPLFATMEYNFASTNFTVGASGSNFFVGPQSYPTVLNVLQPIPCTLVDGTYGPGNSVAVAPPVNVVLSQKSSFDNQPLVITHNGGVELTSGDGTVIVTLYYISVNC